MEKYFGTDGIRGIFLKEITEDLAYRTGLSVGHLFGGPCIVGRDTRVSGEALEQALVKGITDAGTDACLVGVLPTPAVAMLAKTTLSGCAVMISASHNPPNYNGFKIFFKGGLKLTKSQEDAVEYLIENPLPVQKNKGKATFFDAAGDYIKRLCDSIPKKEGELFKGIRVLLDCGFGAASGIAKNVYATLGARVVSINDSYCGDKINVDCGALYAENLSSIINKGFNARQIIENNNILSNDQNSDSLSNTDKNSDKSNNTDSNFFKRLNNNQSKEDLIYFTHNKNDFPLGFAFDGDADRMSMVMGKGVLDGDSCLYSLSRIIPLREGVVVGTLMSNLALENMLKSENKRLLRTNVGDKYIQQQLVRGNYSLGGEESGHYIFYPQSVSGDGILASLMMTRAYLSGNAVKLRLVPQKTVSLDFSKKNGDDIRLTRLYERLKKELSSVLIRLSGTEPKIRITIQDENKDLIDAAIQEFCDIIAQINNNTGESL